MSQALAVELGAELEERTEHSTKRVQSMKRGIVAMAIPLFILRQLINESHKKRFRLPIKNIFASHSKKWTS